MQYTPNDALRLDGGVLQASPPKTSEIALQRVAVRMLFDRSFAEQVTKDPASQLADLKISEELLHQLRNLDVRLWYADRLRPLRAMKVLLSEFRISTTLYLDAVSRWQDLMDFFKHRFFHQSVMNRGYMALAFADYLFEIVPLATKHKEAVQEVLKMERGMALARRLRREWKRRPSAFHPQHPSPALRLRPGTVVVRLRVGTIQAIQTIERFLFEASEIPALSLCSDAPRPTDTDLLLTEGDNAFLLESSDEGTVSTSELTDDYARLCEAIAGQNAANPFCASLEKAPPRDQALLEALIDAGVVVAFTNAGGI